MRLGFRGQLIAAFLAVLGVALASTAISTLLLTEAHSQQMGSTAVVASHARDHFLAIARRSLLLGVLIGAVVAVVLALLLARGLARPIRAVSAAAEELARGRHPPRVRVHGGVELGQLATRFNEMASSLADLEALRRELVVTVSHELRTPLTSIQGYLQGMREGVFPREEQTLRLIEEEADRLERLVEDLSELSRAEADAAGLQREETDIRALIDETIDKLAPQFGARSIEPTVCGATELRLPVDRARLQQVLINVLDNALRYTPPGGSIEVQLVRGADGCAILVRDSGPGIDPEHLPRVFERFYRAEPSRSRASGGIGVGLTIAQQLIERHGGRIAIESTPGEGTTVRLWLPAQGVSDSGEAPAQRVSAPRARS